MPTHGYVFFAEANGSTFPRCIGHCRKRVNPSRRLNDPENTVTARWAGGKGGTKTQHRMICLEVKMVKMLSHY